MTAASRSANSKILLPTIETCGYRKMSAATETASCELLREISGVNDRTLCGVTSEACIACCQSFPSTPSVWNSVIVSLVYGLAERIVDISGVEGCSLQRAIQLRNSAAAMLDVDPFANSVLIPRRTLKPCCFLGDIVTSDETRQTTTSREIHYQCHHPAHRMTTVEDCKRCSDWAEWSGVSRRMLVHEMVPAPAHSAQAKVRNWSVGVLTAPRREATLEWCLDGLFRAGFQEPHLFIDGLLRVPERYAGLPITWRERSIGAWPSYLLALSEMVQRDTDADAYLLLQDDAVMFDQGNVREYLESCLWFDDRPGLVSLYCPQPYTLLDPGWHVLPKTWVWGALAFVFPRSLAREFVQHPDVVSHRWNGISAGRAQVDVLIGEWAALHGHKVHYPCPGLVQHVGNTSSLWNDAENQGFRRADWFAGDVDSPFAMSSRWSDFPDERFACRPEFRAEYEQRILTGRMRMSEQRVVICGLCRNVRHFLPRFAARVEQLGSMFRDYRVVLYENDSIDATVEFLEDWQRGNSRVHFQSDQLGSVRYPSIRSAERAARMAEYRNRCRRDVLENFGDYDKVMVVDTDLAGGWSYQGIANTFGHEAWDFVGSCGLIRRCHEQDSEWIHYDAWAFRAINHPSPHSVREVDSLPLEVGLPLMPVLSCFGGLGIYQLHAFAAAEYGGPDCEHVVFHDRMRQQGFDRLFLNPSQVVIYSPD